MIPFINRFHGHGSLRYVNKNGQAVRSHIAVLKSINNPHRKHTRVAVVISKKILKSAVGRNRIRRRIYEYVRLRLPKIHGIHDVVIIVTSSEVRNMPHEQLYRQLDKLFEQAEL